MAVSRLKEAALGTTNSRTKSVPSMATLTVDPLIKENCRNPFESDVSSIILAPITTKEPTAVRSEERRVGKEC